MTAVGRCLDSCLSLLYSRRAHCNKEIMDVNDSNVTRGRLPEVIAQEQDPATIITYHGNFESAAPDASTTMSWTGQSRALVGQNPNVVGTVPSDPPPDYSHPFIPTRPVNYTFSLIDHDAMILVPPVDALDSRPLYHISVSINPFIPSMSTTTIRRGATANGECAATLEWGSKRLPSCVSMGGTQLQRSDVFHVMGRPGVERAEYSVQWEGHDAHRMYWICDKHVATCYLRKGRMRPNVRQETPLARFHGRTVVRDSGNTQTFPAITLLVDPDGHVGPRLDLIVLGALMIERTRDELD